MSAPPLHMTRYDPDELIGLRDISIKYRIAYGTLRCWSCGARTSQAHGPMPWPVARVSNRMLWMRDEIEAWMQRARY